MADFLRAIARDPVMFPEPEVFNPLRWIEPGYPTYQEPLTQYPTIINSTQFGYGRRTCLGQTVADEDLFMGIGSIAWLFKIEKVSSDNSGSNPDAKVNVAVDSEKVGPMNLSMNSKASISSEELNTGVDLKVSSHKTMEDVLVAKYEYPGTYPTPNDTDEKNATEKSTSEIKKPATTIDPTLDFTTLLIAKPLPFKFHLRPRDYERVTKVQNMFNEGLKNGDYRRSREFWGENQGKDKPLGWGKV